MAEKKRLEVTYVPSSEMYTDGMTKPSGRVAYKRPREQLGLVDMETL